MVQFGSFLILLTFFAGCAHDEANVHRGGSRAVRHSVVESHAAPENITNSPQLDVQDKIENVWKAVQLTMAAYPIKVNDQDSGIMETDQIKGDMIWKPVGTDVRVSGGYHYSLVISAKKITGLEGSPSIRISVTKKIEKQADFFAPIEAKASDGSEEAAILYRIRRELQMDRILMRTSR